MLLSFGIYNFIVTVLCLLLLIGNVIYLAVIWGDLPQQIPGHYDFAGNVTRYDSKGTLFIVPAINLVLFIGLAIIQRFPSLWNTGVRITEENRVRVYKVLRNMLVTTKLSIVITFVFISVFQTLDGGLPGWFLGAIFWLIFAPIVIFIILLLRAR